MLDGGQFVEALGRLGYPGATSLKGSSFDWLFDCAPENLHFLRFVCRTLGRANVLAPEEARAFRELQKSGKPLLDEAALGQVLKTVGPADGSNASQTWFVTGENDASVEELEAKLQALQREKVLKQRRHSKLQVLATARGDAGLRLSAEQERASALLKEGMAAVGAENANANALLENLTEEVGRLASYLPAEPEVPPGKKSGVAVAPTPAGPKAAAPRRFQLISQLSLDPYLHQEELNTKTLSAFTQKQFFRGISDMVETCSDGCRLLDLSSCDGREGEEEEEEEEEFEENEKGGGGDAVERRRTEMARLQWAFIVGQHQLLQATAEEHSLKAGLAWLSETGSRAKSMLASSSLAVREAVSRRQLQAVEAELEALVRGRLPGVLREASRLLNVPVVRGDLALQLARQDYYTSRQDQVRDYLLRQKSLFDLLLLALEVELRGWRTALKQLGDTRHRLSLESEQAALRADALAQPELVPNPRPSPIISCQDASFSRLLQVLEGSRCGAGQGPAEPFRTHEALDQAALDLSADLQAAREALAGAARQQGYTAARLQGDCEALHRATYTELQQLVLEPQVCPTAGAGQELLCPNAQELSLNLADAESQLQRLQRLMQDIMGEVRAKRSQLERSTALRRERDLYVYFHLDPRLLQRAVKDQEAKAAGRKGQH
ncbi:unnamed protein product [Gadus morhua 'NCC']